MRMDRYPSSEKAGYLSRLNANSPAKTPFFFIKKIHRITLYKVLCNGIERQAIFTLLEKLASLRKILLNNDFGEIGSLTLWKK